MWAKDSLECYEQSLIGISQWTSEEQTVDRNIDNTGQAQKVSVGNKNNWNRGRMCFILAKNVCTFFPYPETFREAEFKGGKLIALLEQRCLVHSALKQSKVTVPKRKR